MRKLITPEEAVKLSEFNTVGDFNTARDIAKGVAAEQRDRSDLRWTNAVILAAVWNAGRVQGIREERARHKRPADSAIKEAPINDI